MPWAAVAAAVGAIAASQAAREYEPVKPEPTDCASCGAPLSIYATQCDYCKRVKEPQMFNWFKRTPKETPVQARLRMAAEQRLHASLRATPASRGYSAPSPAPTPAQSSIDPVSAALWYTLGNSSSHTPSPGPAPEPERFSSGGGGNFGGGGATSSWESSPSNPPCSAPSSSDSSSYSSSSSDSGSSSSFSCGSD